MNNQANPIFQTEKASNTSDKYGFVSSKALVDVFESKGWQLKGAQVARTNNPEKQGYQKHLLKFENPALPTFPGTDDKIQLVMLNSHDATTSLRLFYGVLRMACLNGIIAGTSLRDFRAVHSQSITKRLGDGIEYMTGNVDGLLDSVTRLKELTINEEQLHAFIRECALERLKNVKNVVTVDFSGIDRARRTADLGQDAWTILNRVQETVIRGGIQYDYVKQIKDPAGNVLDTRLVNAKTRGLASISSQVKLNQFIYDKALEYAA